MNPRRLLQMGPVEICGRVRRGISKWVDRQAPWIQSRRGPERYATPELPSSGFFPGVLDQRTVSILRHRIPSVPPRTLLSAETLLNGRFDLLGYRGLVFGEPLDWHLDPVTGRRAPLQHWSRLDPLDSDTLGDSKVIWELNRHQWLVRLGQAYRLSGDERFAEAFARHIRDWIHANPPGIGLNWASSLEVSFRLISWSWALHLFLDSKALTPDMQAFVLRSLWSHARHVERYLSYYFSPNSHLTGEALGLFYAGVLFAGLPRAERWRTLGKRILEQESRRQILPDGVYFEQSTCYQRYTAEIYLHFLVLARQNSVEVSEGTRARIVCLLDALLLLLRPDHSMPQIGDGDGGRLLPLDLRGPEDVQEVFSTSAVIFRRTDYAWAAGQLAPETLWLLGPSAADLFDELRPAPPSAEPSRALPAGGYVVMRTTWEKDADQVILDTGPLGCPYSSGHGHADLLGLQCTFGGRPYVLDPGTFCYTGDEGWRAYFRSTAAHSTVEIDGAGQASPLGPFAWDQHPRARLLRWDSRPDLDFVQAEHRAYEKLPGSIVHRRTVILLKPGSCVVVDDVGGVGEHRIDVRFQFAPMSVTLDPAQWVRVVLADAGGLFVRGFATLPLKTTIAEGDLDPRQGWISTDYGVRCPAPTLVYSVVATPPMRIITLLSAAANLRRPPAVSALSNGTALLGLDLGDGRALYVDEPRLRSRVSGSGS